MKDVSIDLGLSDAENCYDTLTGLYTYKRTISEINRILKSGKEEYHAVILIQIDRIDSITARYGKAFARSIIENASIYIMRHFSSEGKTSVIGRIRKDAFMIFTYGDFMTQEYVEKLIQWSYEEQKKSYYGEDKNVTNGVIIGMYGMQPGSCDLDAAIEYAEDALYYAQRRKTGIEIYSPNKKYIKSIPVKFDYEQEEIDERLYTYDNRFISFAVSILANAKDIDSSLNLLLQRIGWQFHFNDINLCLFEEGEYVRIIGRYKCGQGIITPPDKLFSLDNMGGFLRSFNSTGCMKIKDTSVIDLNTPEAAYYKKYNIGSIVSYLLYDSEHLIGYIKYSKKDTLTEWREDQLNTLTQITKIVELFAGNLIHVKNDQKVFDELSRDTVTGFYTYPAFLRNANKRLSRFDKTKKYYIVCSDIDNFSFLNESFGYEVGDATLCALADHLHSVATSGSLYCRVTADRFVALKILNADLDIYKEVKAVNTWFFNYNNERYPLSDLKLSTGIFEITDPNVDLIQAIDCANHVRKSIKGNMLIDSMMYSDDFSHKRTERLKIVGSIHAALENGDIEVFLQPKFSMKEMKVIGAEALSRWRNPDGSYKNPAEFIPILEDSGYVVDVDFYMYEHVLMTIRRWMDEGKKVLPVSVNFSRIHISRERFSEKIKALAEKYSVDPKYIEIEITESGFSLANDNLIRYMTDLRSSGFKIDMDDFGTGYSSLNMLLDMPADIIKVDKSFINDCTSVERKAYVKQIGNLILSAKKDIIFEGVETIEQLNYLVDCGYANAQGYIFSRPVKLTEFEDRYIYCD